MTNEVFRDKRLLGALDYIDERFIAEVTESYTFEAPGEYKRDKKTVFRAYRQFAALAACLLLLSAAFPVLNYAVQRFGTGTWAGNAVAGTSELEVPTLEETQTLETEAENTEAEILNSGFDKYLEAFADMSADEIYAEVLKGGWVVIQDTNCENIVAIELWTEFLNAVEQGKECSVLIAYYSDHVTIKFVGADDEQYAGISQIVLTEVKYDGNKYVKSTKWFHPDYKNFYSSEYSYLLNERSPFTDRTTYYLANKPDQRLNDIRYSSEKVSMDSAIIVGDGLITVWDH